MRIKNLFCAVVVGAILLCACAAAVSAQVVQASGTVTLKKADGTAAPVEGAQVTIYRTDIRGKYEVKTGKSGRYVYAGIPLTGTYTIAVSAPGANPTFQTGIRFNSEKPFDFELAPGDGSVLTLERINAAGPAPANAGAGPESADVRKAREEMAKKQAELDVANKKVTETNAQIEQHMKAGNEAFTAKKYDEALAAYEAGIQADPEQAVFYRNKAIVLQIRGVEKYNVAVKAKDNAGRDAAKADFKAATESSEKAVTLYRDVISKRAAGGAQAAAPGRRQCCGGAQRS
ncbi:MAG: carboxypeptidase-like regulatory domain-containing protein [Pyrinomonadaceae bacterium]